MFSKFQPTLKYYQQKLNRFENNQPKSNEVTQFNQLKKAITAIKKHLDITVYDEQILGAFVLADNKIAEMKTGEGKTLTATLASIMMAPTGRVHVITVNDYLASRDYQTLKPVYEDCGLSVGLVMNSSTNYRKKSAYSSDIVYVTNSELGFDLLRDYTASSKDTRVISYPLNYGLIDEIDAILIDDARTPLILSATTFDNIAQTRYLQASAAVQQLTEEHFTINKKSRNVQLTALGHNRIKERLQIESLYSPENVLNLHLISNALKATFIEREGIDYIIKKGKIELIDQNGGRVLDGRRYNDGLMQALEAKEHLEIQGASKTLASITYQNLARLFKNISGMTGTAKSESKEFEDLYNLKVIQIPTHRPMIRKDLPDRIFETQSESHNALIKMIEDIHSMGQPLLIAADSTRRAEQISRLLRTKNILHTLLTARDASKEAQIIKDAGKESNILVTTALAGRGTDIVLQGKRAKEFGLYVIGIGRGRNKRIDNQLRGRSGRQGDPGTSQFLVSHEDDLFNVIENPEHKKSGEIKWSIYSPDYVQVLSEAKDFDSRKQTLEYDDVLREQRNAIYTMRDKLLDIDIQTSNIKDLSQPFVQNLSDPILKIDLIKAINAEKITVKQFKDAQIRILDLNWSDYMAKLDYLKDTMVYRSYSARNPLIEFQYEAKALFESFITQTRVDISIDLLKPTIKSNSTRHHKMKNSNMRQFVKTK